MFVSHPLYFGEWMLFGDLKTVDALHAMYGEVPYCWRLLIPALVSIMLLPAKWGFSAADVYLAHCDWYAAVRYCP